VKRQAGVMYLGLRFTGGSVQPEYVSGVLVVWLFGVCPEGFDATNALFCGEMISDRFAVLVAQGSA
jgi:hypothetical protein